MNTRLSSALILMALCILTITFSGCAANRVDIVKKGVVTLERQREGKVYIAWSSAYEQDDGFVITGVLMRHDHAGSALKTHVDVTVLSYDAKKIIFAYVECKGDTDHRYHTDPTAGHWHPLGLRGPPRLHRTSALDYYPRRT